jgi:hypothetical protein
VWRRTFQGRELHFYLAGINNQNFLMRDKETGTWWQQITGLAVYGPMKGAALEPVSSDELTFGEWKSETTDGKVFAPVEKYKKEYDSNWEPDVAKLPVVISFPGTELKSRDVVVGLELDVASRAYPWDTLVKQSPVMDRVHGTPLLVAVGPDGKSFRVFVSRIDGKDAEFFLKGEPEGAAGNDPAPEKKADTGDPSAASADAKAAPSASPASAAGQTETTRTGVSAPHEPAPHVSTPHAWVLLDSATGSEWNFQGCAVSGASQGKCLQRVYALKDYWFDWRNYHADTTIYKR